MALQSIYRFPDQSMEGSADGRSYQFTWLVRTTEPNEPMLTVASYTGYNIGDPLDELDQFDTASFCSNYRVEAQDVDLKSWLVKLDFTPNTSGQEQIVVDGDARFTVDFAYVQEPYIRDVRGELVANSAGDPPDEPPFRERPIIVWNFTVYRSSFNSLQWGQYLMSVNSNVWKGVPAGKAQLISLAAEFKIDSAFESGGYWIVNYTFHIDLLYALDELVYLDKGLNEKYIVTEGEEAGQEKLRRIQIDGIDATSPVLLDGNGQARPLGTPVFLTRRPYNRVPFNFGF